jgi:hypothetical protein
MAKRPPSRKGRRLPLLGRQAEDQGEGEPLARIEARLERIERRISGGVEAPPPGGRHPGAAGLDDLASTFARVAGEAVDRRLEDVLPAVAGLHDRLSSETRAMARDPEPPAREDLEALLGDVVSELSRVLRTLGGQFIVPEVGEPYDPLIHVAVGESPGGGPGTGLVAGVVRAGYRSARGRVVLPARVLLGRN